MFSKIRFVYRNLGLLGLIGSVGYKIWRPKTCCYMQAIPFFDSKTGLEIGGPSSFFRKGGLFPVYPLAGRIDNCNFSSETIWEGTIQEGMTFLSDKRKSPGRQFLTEATDLTLIDSESYDFILSCHTLVHIANPLRALYEWKRVLKQNGLMVLILTDREKTFDYHRPVSTLQYILNDYEHSTGEDDLTHLGEILQLHDFGRDPGGLDFQSFKDRSEKNIKFRALHPHVFDSGLLIELMNHIEMQVLWVEKLFPNHIFLAAQKSKYRVVAIEPKIS